MNPRQRVWASTVLCRSCYAGASARWRCGRCAPPPPRGTGPPGPPAGVLHSPDPRNTHRGAAAAGSVAPLVGAVRRERGRARKCMRVCRGGGHLLNPRQQVWHPRLRLYPQVPCRDWFAGRAGASGADADRRLALPGERSHTEGGNERYRAGVRSRLPSPHVGEGLGMRGDARGVPTLWVGTSGNRHTGPFALLSLLPVWEQGQG